MVKKRTDSSIQKVGDASFLAKYVEEDHSLDDLKQHRVVPRVKLIQSTTDQALKKQFGEGSAVLRPGDALICKYEDEPDSFDFVPIFFFVEFAKWQDLKAKSGPMVEERSHDPASELAKRARDPKRRFEVYKGQDGLDEKEQCRYRYVEHLRFIGLVYGDHPLKGTPVTVSFERGEFGQGKNFISAISLRREMIEDKPIPVPLWAQVWRLIPAYRELSADRRWYGFKFEAGDPPTIRPDEAESMRQLHNEMKELFEKQRLIVDDEATEEEQVEDTGEF